MQAHAGARLDYLVSSQVFDQILHLKPIFTERASVGGQVTRIREFEIFRDLFSGALATLLLDLPFILIFVAVIGFIAGPLAFIPIVLVACYALLGYVIMPLITERSKISGDKRSKRHSFMVELLWWMRSIKQLGGEETWAQRFRTMSGDASWANLKVNRLNAVSQDIAQSLMIVAGAATLVLGVFRAMEGSMTLGALIATMMLVWRILSPIQTIFSLAGRIEQTQKSLQQLLGVLAYEREQNNDSSQLSLLKFKGHIRFDRVSMRYVADTNPALLGLSFKVEPGEFIGIVGESGSGKSTLAKLILGLYTPQGGAVTLDGIDIRQMKPIALRQALAYVPQHNHAFPGSLLQNIRLADPTASLDQIKEACRKAGVLNKIEALPNGFDTNFKEGLQAHVPQGFLRQIALARAFLRDAPVFIFDEPASGLEQEDEQAFLKTIADIRGHKTIIMITQRPSHMKLCDKLLVLNHGQLELFGKTEAVLAQMQKDKTAQ
jgi:ATP-binding cassette subfamily C protein/ATP-binding cassette subfamily C protein LapB